MKVRRACLAPGNDEGDDWLCNNIFKLTCTIGGKAYKLIIDLVPVRT